MRAQTPERRAAVRAATIEGVRALPDPVALPMPALVGAGASAVGDRLYLSRGGGFGAGGGGGGAGLLGLAGFPLFFSMTWTPAPGFPPSAGILLHHDLVCVLRAFLVQLAVLADIGVSGP